MTIKQHGGVFGRNPSFNDVEVQSLTIAGNAVPDASTILVDGDIGSTVQGYDADTAKLDVAQTFSASQTFTSAVNIEAAGEPQLNLQIGGLTYGHFRLDSGDLVIGTGTTGIKFYDFASAVAPATSTTGGLVNNSLDLGSSSFNWRSAYIGTSVVMANGAGIDFSATAGTGTSELFDDYEEGTFTPTFSNLTLGNGTTEGRYTKIGRNVILEVNVTWGSTTSASAYGGMLKPPRMCPQNVAPVRAKDGKIYGNRCKALEGGGEDPNFKGSPYAIDGMGFMNRKIKIGKGIAVQEQPRYRTFGKYIIHIPYLENDNVLNVKFQSMGSIPSIKPVSIDDNFKEFIMDILNTSQVNQQHYNSLTEAEKAHFHKIVKGAGLSNALKFKADDKIDDKKDVKRLDILVGQIVAGNDNDKVMKEAKELIKKCVSNGSITRHRGMDLLFQIE